MRFSPNHSPRFSRVALPLLLAGSLLAGCAHQEQPLYYWGSYQQQVYGHLSSKASPDEQREKLEAGIEEARSKNLPLPPGYRAHLALLYGENGQVDDMRRNLEAEKTQFPESGGFVDFLLKNISSSKK